MAKESKFKKKGAFAPINNYWFSEYYAKLKSKLTFFASLDFAKAINTSLSFFETISLYNDKIQIK